MPVKVLLVDDEPDVRAMVRVQLRLRGNFDVVGEAADGETALALAAERRPEVILLDLGLPRLAGRDLIARVRRASPRSQIVVYTGRDVAPESLGPIAAFARKDLDVERLVDMLSEIGTAARDEEELALPRDTASAAVARRWVVATCARWGCERELDQIMLVVSELVTNAVVHARSSCTLRLSRRGDSVRVDVVDGGEGSPDLHRPDESAENGRGLYLISAMSSAWGVEPMTSGGKSVWAELAC